MSNRRFWSAIFFFCVLALVFSLPLHCQDIYVPACSTNYSCQVASGVPWTNGNQTWVFAPIAPNVSIYVYVHNRNTTSAHTSQTLSIYQTGSTTVSNLSSNADQWAQDAVQQNSVVGASCNNLNASAPLSPGASGTGTCYVSTMATAQVAIKITGAASAAGSPDVFDIGIVQIAGYAAGPQPGAGEQQVSVVVSPTTPADNTPNTNIPGNQSYQMVFDGTNWDRATEPTGDGVTNSGIAGIGPVLFNGTTYDRQRSSSASGTTGIPVATTNTSAGTTTLNGYGMVPSAGIVNPLGVVPILWNSTSEEQWKSVSSINNLGAVGSAISGVALVSNPASWTSTIQAGSASNCSVSIAATAGIRHCATGITMCTVATVVQPGMFVNLRDGTTGAGTVKWNGQVGGFAVGGGGCYDHEFSEGPICGTTNVAMTLEYNNATAATNACDSAIKGYDIQ